MDETNKQGWVNVMEIVREEESIFIKIIERKSGIYKPLKSKEMKVLLKKKGDFLFLKRGMNNFQLNLSDNNNTLKGKNKLYKRINIQEYQKINKEMVKKVQSANEELKKEGRI